MRLALNAILGIVAVSIAVKSYIVKFCLLASIGDSMINSAFKVSYTLFSSFNML